MVSGFALGGFGSAFQKGMEQNSIDDYRTRELKLRQQGQENAMQREQQVRIDGIVNDSMKTISDSINTMRTAKPDLGTDQLAKHFMPWVESTADVAERSGRPGGRAAILAQFANTLALPPKTETIAAEARAKDVYGEAQARAELLRSEARMNRELTGGETPAPSPGTPQTGAPAQPEKTIPGAGMTLDPNDAGDKYLATQPEQLRQVIKDVAEYRRNPTSLAGRTIKGTGSSYRDLVMNKVEAYAAARGEPFDQTNYAARSKTATAFAGGPEARSTRSFNVLVSHLDTLKEATTALKNGDYTALNRLKNIIASETGHPEPDSFDAIKGIVGDEVVKAVLGSGSGALGDREAIAARINNAKSPAILLKVIDDYQKLGGGQLEGLKQQYESSGFPAGSFEKKFLLPKTRQYFGTGAGAGGKSNGSTPQSGTSGPVKWKLEP